MPPLDSLSIFNAQPGATLLLSPDWVIVGASDDYLAVTLTERDIIVGQHIFDAFPDNPATPEANAVANVRASLETVLATKQPHEMAPQHYDVPDPALPGRFVERHWQPRHTPVLDAAGQVQFIIQSVQDITASRQAERQLRESVVAEQVARAEAELQRQRFYDVLMALPAQVATYHGPDHTYHFVNAAYQRYFPTPDLPGRSLRKVLPEVEDQGVLAIMDRVYQTGEPSYQQELEVWLDFEGNGQPRQLFLNVLFHPLRGSQGRVDGVLDFSYDVTEQVLARRQVEQLNQQLEAARAEAERERSQLQALIAQAPVAIGLFEGEDLRITSVNAVISALWGYTPAHVLGRPLLEAVPELQGQGFDDLLRQVLHTQVAYTGTEAPATLQRDGQLHMTYFNFVYQPLYEAEGQVTGVLCIAVDVTGQVVARQQVEQLNQELEVRVAKRTAALKTALNLTEQQREQLRGQQQHLLRLFEQAPVAIYVLHGPTYVMEVVNPAMSELIGPPLTELLGKPYFEAVPELADQGYPAFLAEVWRTGQPFVAREQPAKLRRHGPSETGYFTFVYQPLHDAQGRMTDIMCVAVDVTDQVIARQQVHLLNEELTAKNHALHESNAQLTRTNVDLDTFVYTASHDLKAPISNIESITLALRDTLPADVQQDEMIAHLLDLLEHTTARFQLTIGQLTDLSKLQLAHAGPAEPVPLAAVIESVRLDLAPAMVEANAQLTVAVAPDLRVSFSPANLRSAVYNLLSNAVKYRALDRPAQVQVRAYSAGPRVVLEVQDNGLGLNAHQQSRLFGLFQRLHTHVEGTGVGLYTTKRLVENGGGTIAVESQVDVGTTLTLTFPA
ncbi:MAG: PAS domain-containing sensor histidine kinase [Janthinobacterium lividum]